MGSVIGIDLGTTNSCAAVVRDGAPVVVTDKNGYRTTPSVVALADDATRLVGHPAKRQAVVSPENTVYAFKRLIGRRWDSVEVISALESMPYRIVEGPRGDVRVLLGNRACNIPELAAHVLDGVREMAGVFLGEPVRKAVITVPAYFNDHQRQATRDAGRIAGLDVIRIINEPTAAALAYGFGRDLDKRVAVYDWGGGTFDITILDVAESVFDVVRTAGDTFLGGEDFDSRVVDWLLFGFAKEHRIDLGHDTVSLQRLRDAAEKAKCDLSTVTEVEIHLPFLFHTDVDGSGDGAASGQAPPGDGALGAPGDGRPRAASGRALHLERVLTRGQLEELTADLVDRTIEICKRTVTAAGMVPSDIDEVILVGGMTRMPRVREAVASYFGKPPFRGVHPDEVVAQGAAIQGAALLDDRTELLLLDVTPHSLGIIVAGGAFHRIIRQNRTVPTSATETFTTYRDGQTEVRIVVMQGESDRAADNEPLGEFVLTGLRPAPGGEVDVEVQFDINADGLVNVSARDTETGTNCSTTVTTSHGLTEAEIRESGEFLVYCGSGNNR